MFNIKNIVKNLADRVEVGRSVSVSSADEVEAAGGAEGFLCPTCMKSFSSPEQLQQHDQTAHVDPSATYLCPVCKARLTSSPDLEQHFVKNHPAEPQSDDIQVLQHELTDLNTTLREERWYSDELKREVARLQNLVDSTQSEEALLYQQQITALQESKALVTSEVMLLRKQLTESLESITTLKQDYKSLQEKAGGYAAEKAALSAAVDEAQGRVQLLESQLKLKESADDAAVLRQELVQVQHLMDSAAQEQEAERNKLQAELSQLQEKCRKLESESQSEIGEYKTSVEGVECQTAQPVLQSESMQLQENGKEGPSDDMIKQLAETERLRQQLETERSKLEAANQSLTQLRAQLADSANHLSSAECESAERQTALEEARQRLEASAAEQRQLQEKTAELHAQLEQHTQKAEQSDQQLAASAAEHRQLQQQAADLRAQLAAGALQQRQLQQQTTELKSQLAQSTQEAQRAQQVDRQLAESRKRCEALNTEVNEKSQLATSLERELRVEQARQAELSGQLKTAVEQQQRHQQEQDALRATRDTLEAEKLQAESALARLRETSKVELLEKEQEVTVARAEAESAAGRVSQLEATVDEAERRQAELTKQQVAWQVECDRLKTETAQLSAKLESSESTAATARTELQQLKARYELQLEALQESLSSVRSELHQQTAVNAELQKRLDEILSEKLELEAQVGTGEDERRALVERCLDSERELERQKAGTVELRRKLDDTTAALQEMARENQMLQMETARAQDRKWTDDSQVTVCHGCDKEFTLTVRKHHCRSCGQIFCKDCSARTATLPSSKKPVRVCESCFTEVTAK